MKILIGVDFGTYTFNAVAKTITLSGLNSVALEQVLLITNANTNEIIYQFNKVGYGATIAANVITLDFDTTAMSNSDSLQIFIDYESNLATSANQATQIANQTNETQQTGTFGGNTDASTNISVSGWTAGTSNFVIAANSNRRGISITNCTNKTVLLRVGGTITAANYTVSLSVGGLYELPLGLSRLAINGLVTATVNGNLVLSIANK